VPNAGNKENLARLGAKNSNTTFAAKKKTPDALIGLVLIAISSIADSGNYSATGKLVCFSRLPERWA
jgi:hypothetical protein